jgi:hypothetical protein
MTPRRRAASRGTQDASRQHRTLQYLGRFFSRKYNRPMRERASSGMVRVCCTPIWTKQMLFGGGMVMFNVCLFDNARAQLGCCATTGRKYPLTTLRTEGGAGTNLARTNGVVWPCSMRRLARGSIAAQRRDLLQEAVQSHPTQGTGCGRGSSVMCSRGTKHLGRTGRRLTGPRVCRALASPSSKGHGSGREPARAISFSLDPISAAAARGRRGAARRHDLADSRSLSAEARNLLSTGRTRRPHPSPWLALRGLALQGCRPTAPARIPDHTSSILVAILWVLG